MKPLTLSMVMLCASSLAFAQQPGRRPSNGIPPNRLLQALDVNGDGEISADEIKQASKLLLKLDRDGDGEISERELGRSPMFGGRSGQGFSRPDSTGTNRLSQAGLKVGSPLPDVTVYDAKGAELPLLKLKGKYTVLVFGCLT